MKCNEVNRWLLSNKTPNVNPRSIRHIVSAPNHIRVWNRDIYCLIGRHNVHLPIVDDYELIVRTFLYADIIFIPEILYLQYRNDGGNNFTFIRNDEIQKIINQVAFYYKSKITDRIKELNKNDGNIANEEAIYDDKKKLWEQKPEYAENILSKTYYEKNRISIIICLEKLYSETDVIKSIESVISQKNYDLIVVSNPMTNLNHILNKLFNKLDDRTRWWVLRELSSIYQLKNYALRCLLRTDLIYYLEPGQVCTNLAALYKIYQDYPNKKDIFLYYKDNILLHDNALVRQKGYWSTTVSDQIKIWSK